MTLDGVSPPSSSPKSLVTLDILLNLLQARGLNDTADCLKREAGFPQPTNGFPPIRKGEPSIADLVSPATEEALRQRAQSASMAQAEQQRRIASLAQEMAKQGTQMSEIRDLVHRVRNAASAVNRPSLEEQEEQIKRNEAELRELEVICAERDALGRNLRLELDRTSSEVAELRRTLEEREDEETKARIQLTRLEEEALKLSCELETVPVQTQARKIQALLAAWHDEDGHLQIMVRQLFFDMDRDKDGRLEWNNNEIRTTVVELFRRSGINLPSWQEHVWYEMYRRADSDGSYSLELCEVIRFARSCFEAALALVLTGQAENGADVSIVSEFGRNAMASPVARSAMTYSSGVVIDFLEYGHTFTPVITANAAHRVRMVRLIETGEHLKATMRTYRECDKDGNGRLTWNNGEIRDFISACFLQHGLTPPNEEQMFAMYSAFDKDRNNALDMRECLEMVDALFRSTFSLESTSTGSPAQKTGAAPQYMRTASPLQGTMARVIQMAAPGTTMAPGTMMMAPTTMIGRSVSPGQGQRQLSPPMGRTLPQNVLRQDLFDKIDANHDGVISREELNSAVRSGSVRSEVSRLSETVAVGSGRGRPQSPLGYPALPVGTVFAFPGAPGVPVRMNSGRYSPGAPIPGAVIGQMGGSPRPTSPDGRPVVYARTASPLAGTSLSGEGTVLMSGATSQAGSFVSGGGIPTVNVHSLGRSGSNEQLQAARVSAGRMQRPQILAESVVTAAGGARPINRLSAARNPMSGLAPVLRTRGAGH